MGGRLGCHGPDGRLRLAATPVREKLRIERERVSPLMGDVAGRSGESSGLGI